MISAVDLRVFLPLVSKTFFLLPKPFASSLSILPLSSHFCFQPELLTLLNLCALYAVGASWKGAFLEIETSSDLYFTSPVWSHAST